MEEGVGRRRSEEESKEIHKRTSIELELPFEFHIGLRGVVDCATEILLGIGKVFSVKETTGAITKKNKNQ